MTIEEMIIELQQRITYIQNNRGEYISDRISILSNRIKNKPDKQPKHKGNLTMKQYLITLRTEIETKPQIVVDDYLTKLRMKKENLEDGNSRN